MNSRKLPGGALFFIFKVYRSNSILVTGFEQQISNLPVAGGSKGSGLYTTFPSSKELSQ
jgi:hypothetical protein